MYAFLKKRKKRKKEKSLELGWNLCSLKVVSQENIRQPQPSERRGLQSTLAVTGLKNGAERRKEVVKFSCCEAADLKRTQVQRTRLRAFAQSATARGEKVRDCS